ncbi:MAG: PIG-L deacetylase family protein, partial [Actinomycetes bacterium]
MTYTLVAFHAHPDDEALLTAGTMARAAAQGHRVVLVVATDGGRGLVGSGFLAGDETLADRRLAELLVEEAADAVTIYDPAGGYGHPDHVQVHRVGTRAAELAG